MTNRMMDQLNARTNQILAQGVGTAIMGEKVEPKTPIEHNIFDECTCLARMLIRKNRAYGNSALDPLRIFSKADPIEQLKVRIDDKLSRIARGIAAGEDVTLDLIGYLVLLRVATVLKMREEQPREAEE